MLRPLSCLAALALAGCATVPPPSSASAVPMDVVIEATRVLSSDAFEGRAPGGRGEEMTLAYLAEQFAAAGLQPGNNGSWLQEVPLVEITGSNYAPLAIAGMELRHGTDWVGVSYRETAETVLANSEIVFVGYGINAPERGWNDYAGIDMRGKTALILVNDPDHTADSLEGAFNGRAMTYYGRWTYKFEEAARQGAAAALIVHEDFAASYGWNVVESSWSGPQLHTERPNGGAGETLVNGWVQQDVARRIAAAGGHDLAVLAASASRPGFRPVPLGITASTRFANSFRRFSSHNVIGILPGRERPGEYVIHTAHWDHLGRCTPAADGDDICNGAVDNATGTAALIGLARAHREAGPTARTQVFLAVTAEESGLLGAEHYAANPVFPLEATVGGLNMDAMYPTAETRDVTVIGAGKSELDAYLAAALAAQGRVVSPDPAPQAGRYYRSDHFSFAKRGVPMIYLKTGEDLVEGGPAAGAAFYENYNSQAYHGPQDEFDPAWDWGAVRQDLELYFAVGRALGDTASWPHWLAGDEFRGVREQACAAAGSGCGARR